MKKNLFLFGFALLVFFSCSEEDSNELQQPQLIIQFEMDPTAERQDNLGNPVAVGDGNAAQNPDFEVLGLHFIGLYQNQFTPFENGLTVVNTPTTTAGGETAISFEDEIFLTAEQNEIRVNLNSLTPGTYEYLRSSIGYQKFTIDYNLNGLQNNLGANSDVDIKGVISSFLGFNTYIESYTIKDSLVTVNGNRLQGYFGLESFGVFQGNAFGGVRTGNAAQTTVPNPISATSPVPAGSCVVTGKFPIPLVIPENPTRDIRVRVRISINQSFEWEDGNGNGKFEPLLQEQVVDMGTRGFFPEVL